MLSTTPHFNTSLAQNFEINLESLHELVASRIPHFVKFNSRRFLCCFLNLFGSSCILGYNRSTLVVMASQPSAVFSNCVTKSLDKKLYLLVGINNAFRPLSCLAEWYLCFWQTRQLSQYCSTSRVFASSDIVPQNLESFWSWSEQQFEYRGRSWKILVLLFVARRLFP